MGGRESRCGECREVAGAAAESDGGEVTVAKEVGVERVVDVVAAACWDISSADSPLSPSVNVQVQKHRLTRLRVLVLGCMAF